MNKIMIAFVAALALFTVAGCKKKSGAAGEAVAKYEAWTKAMCACKEGDADCAKKVTDEQIKWGEEMAKTADKNAKVDPKEAEEMAAKMKPIMEEFTKCSMKAMTPAAAKEEPKKEEPAAAKEEPKKDDPAAAKEEPKKDDPAAAKEEPKKDDAKKDAAKKDDKKGGW